MKNREDNTETPREETLSSSRGHGPLRTIGYVALVGATVGIGLSELIQYSWDVDAPTYGRGLFDALAGLEGALVGVYSWVLQNQPTHPNTNQLSQEC